MFSTHPMYWVKIYENGAQKFSFNRIYCVYHKLKFKSHCIIHHILPQSHICSISSMEQEEVRNLVSKKKKEETIILVFKGFHTHWVIILFNFGTLIIHLANIYITNTSFNDLNRCYLAFWIIGLQYFFKFWEI